MALISNGTTIASGGSLSVSVTPPSTFNAVGSYAFLRNENNASTRQAGDTISGSNTPCDSDGNGGTGSSSGTWRVMGKMSGSGADGRNRTTVCIRIS
tara:strand:- start:368 stop:658 length:291 start_codon:yes stop_codon:yes gene_type:complete